MKNSKKLKDSLPHFAFWAIVTLEDIRARQFRWDLYFNYTRENKLAVTADYKASLLGSYSADDTLQVLLTIFGNYPDHYVSANFDFIFVLW